MKKNRIIILIAGICVLGVCSAIVFASTAESTYTQAGRFFRNATTENNQLLGNNVSIVAKYNGEPISSATVEYQKNMSILRDEISAKKPTTDLEVVNNIIKEMILLEEATKQGYTATTEEIDAMMQNAMRAYSLPDGKAAIDEYCQGAGISVQEYFMLLREQLPNVIAKQKLKDAFAKEYCEKHGIEFTRVNPPEELMFAQEAYIEELFKQNQHKIVYLFNNGAEGE